MLHKIALKVLAFAGALLLPATAMASTAIATTDVNLRAGPSTAYPAVNVVPDGDTVEVFGCLQNRSWCDVDYYGQRGWMSSNYIAFLRQGRRYVGDSAVRYLDAPVISFSFGNYWDNHYRSRPFYRDRARYDGIYGPRVFDGPRRRHEDRDRYDGPRRGGGYDSPRRGGDRYDGPRERPFEDRFLDMRDRVETDRERVERRRERLLDQFENDRDY